MAVHHLQRRLLEWGYPDAYSDKDGYYGDLTEKSVREFQNDHGLAGDGKMNAETLLAIFENDQNVTIVIDR
jgi:peptidoglycan hydrolase-like protein with peptidoglycan-binding domain